MLQIGDKLLINIITGKGKSKVKQTFKGTIKGMYSHIILLENDKGIKESFSCSQLTDPYIEVKKMVKDNHFETVSKEQIKAISI